MKIAILGTVCFDEIVSLNGERRESYGGILYNTAALSSVLEEGDFVAPVTRLGEDRGEGARAQFAKLPHVAMETLGRCPEPMMHVLLEWKSVSWRDESARHCMPPYTMADLEPVMGCDAAHLNFIHGDEVELDTLKAFRERYSGLLTLDVHNVISHFGKDGKRRIVGFPQWRSWVPYFDTVQCNEFEIATMIEGDYTDRPAYAAAAKQVCEAGPRAVSITLGPEGAIVVHRKGGEFYCIDIGVLPPVEAVDATGCGDSYSAGFAVGMLRHDDPATAAACASVVAGVNARHVGIGELPEAKGLLASPREHFEVFKGKPADWPGEPI